MSVIANLTQNSNSATVIGNDKTNGGDKTDGGRDDRRLARCMYIVCGNIGSLSSMKRSKPVVFRSLPVRIIGKFITFVT